MAEYDFFAPNNGFDDMGANTPRGRQELSERNDVDPQSFLKTTMLNGYSKASVQEYINTLNQNSSQMRVNFELQIRDLSDERAKLANECSLLRSQIEQIEQQKKSFEDQLALARDHFDQHQEQIDSLSRTAEDEHRQADEARSHVADLEAELDRKGLDLRAKEEEIASLNQRVRDLSAEITSYESEMATLIEKAQPGSQGDAQREEFEREMSVLRDKLAVFDVQQQESEVEKQSLQEEIAERDAHIAELEGKSDGLNSEITQLTEQNAALEKRVEELDLELADLNKRNEALEERSRSLDERMGLQDEWDAAAKKILKKERAKLERQAELLEEENARVRQELKKERAKLERQAESLEEESARVRQEFADKSKQLEERLAASAQEKEQIGERYSVLHERFARSVEKCDQLKADKEALSGLLEQYQAKEREHTLVLRKCEEYGKTVSSLQEVISQLVQEMEEQLARFQEMSAERIAYQEKIRQMAHDKTELQMKNVALLERIDGLSLDLERAEREFQRFDESPEATGGQAGDDAADLDVPDAAELVSDLRLPEHAKDAVRRARDISNLYILNTKNPDDFARKVLAVD